MSDKTIGTESHSAEAAALRRASHGFHKDAYAAPATSFEGIPCRHQPKPGELPELNFGKNSKGCDFKKYPAHGTGPGALDLDVPSIYKVAKEQAVHLRSLVTVPNKGQGEARGSGVIVGRIGNELLVLTDNHVVNDKIHGGRIDATEARLGDGTKTYTARVLVRDRKHDAAIVAVNTGADTDKLYKPASLPENLDSLKDGKKVLVVGYPEASNALHESPGIARGVERQDQLGIKNMEPEPGDDPRRKIGIVEAHTREAESGGGTYNSAGQLVASLEGGMPGDTHISLVNPLTRQYVQGLIRKAAIARRLNKEQD
jgi:hypothetical protein